MRFLRSASLVTIAAFMPLAAAQADDAPPPDSLHGDLGTDIIVTAPFARDRFSLPTAVGVLQGPALTREVRSSIGETLARQPGVSASWFGPNASRPILRGFEGERVRVLTDGIGSFDVSNTSVDHAVAINPLLADRVEIVRGPASLLYGSAAIGGVVNVTDRRIAREVPDEPVHIDASGTLASAAKERGGGAAVDVPLGATGLVLHADGSFLQTGDYRTGGYIFSESLRMQAEAAGGAVAEQAQARGRVQNTDARTWDAAGGLSFIGAGGSIGFAVSRLESNYGIPNGMDLGDGGEADIRLDLKQTRIDARAAVPLGGGFERLTFRFGWADYRHDEVEADGAIGTSFFNQALEARVELVQAERSGWKGASGAQFLSRRFEAAGEEAYIPLNLTDQTGLFTLQQFELGAATAEVGGRWEHTNVRSPVVGVRRSFDSFSLAAGVSFPLAEGWRLALSGSHSERAPSAEELFANGAHAATGAVEIGNPDFVKERSIGAEAVLRGRGAGWRVEVSGFFSRFNDFIFLSPTGETDEEAGLPIFEYRQLPARYWGFEAEGALTVAELGETRVELTALADMVRADILDGGGPVPRIPAFRMIGGIEASGGAFGGRLEAEHVTRQTRIATFETETPAYTLINASVNWRPFGADNGTTVSLSANNIFDVEARRHSSFLKDVAPLPGRDFRLSLRASF